MIRLFPEIYLLAIISDFEDKDHCVLFFMEDLKYSLVERKTIDWEAKEMSTVSVKISGKKYFATLMFIGKL